MSEELERAAEYRVQAATLLKLSEREVDECQKASWLEMVTIYKMLAEQLEEMHARRLINI